MAKTQRSALADACLVTGACLVAAAAFGNSCLRAEATSKVPQLQPTGTVAILAVDVGLEEGPRVFRATVVDHTGEIVYTAASLAS